MQINTNRWDRIRYTLFAPPYDRLVRFGRQRRRSIALLDLRPGERVLISGAGAGADLDHLPEGVEVVAIDITPLRSSSCSTRTAKSALPEQSCSRAIIVRDPCDGHSRLHAFDGA